MRRHCRVCDQRMWEKGGERSGEGGRERGEGVTEGVRQKREPEGVSQKREPETKAASRRVTRLVSAETGVT